MARWLIILAGGRGGRIWPLYPEMHPKQFLSLVGGNNKLQLTRAPVS